MEDQEWKDDITYSVANMDMWDVINWIEQFGLVASKNRNEQTADMFNRAILLDHCLNNRTHADTIVND